MSTHAFASRWARRRFVCMVTTSPNLREELEPGQTQGWQPAAWQDDIAAVELEAAVNGYGIGDLADANFVVLYLIMLQRLCDVSKPPVPRAMAGLPYFSAYAWARFALARTCTYPYTNLANVSTLAPGMPLPGRRR